MITWLTLLVWKMGQLRQRSQGQPRSLDKCLLNSQELWKVFVCLFPILKIPFLQWYWYGSRATDGNKDLFTYPDVLFMWLFRNIFSYRNSKPQNDFKTAYQQIFSLLEFYQQIFSLLCLFLRISQWHVHWVISARGYMCCAQSFSCVWLFVTPWTVARQVPLFTGFLRQEDWCGFPALLQGIFPTRRSNPGLPHCRWILYQVSHQESCGYKDPHQKIFL